MDKAERAEQAMLSLQTGRNVFTLAVDTYELLVGYKSSVAAPMRKQMEEGEPGMSPSTPH